MLDIWTVFLPVFGCIWIASSQKATVVNSDDTPVFRGEFCEGEEFKAECGDDEAIVMTGAKYGRMGLGRCITISLGSLGCHTDVLMEFDQWCSGRRSCDVRVSSVYDGIPEDKQPCSREVRSYLEASYTCVKVISPSTQECLATPKTIISDPPTAFLSSMVTEETGCGSLDSPWQIRLAEGQRMRITMYDFNTKVRLNGDFVGKTPKVCHVYAVIKEESAHSRETVCGSNMRKTLIYTSVSNVVEIRFVAKRKSTNEGYFLMRYEAIGCPEVQRPVNGWLTHQGDTVTAGCNNTDTSWKLSCEEGRWKGTHKNCSGIAAATLGSTDGLGDSFLGLLTGSQWAAIVIIAAIAVTLGLIIFLIGLVYLRRKRTRFDRRPSGGRERPSMPDYYSQQAPPPSDIFPPMDYSTKASCGHDVGYMGGGSAENDYFRTWQLQRHPPGARMVAAYPPDTGAGHQQSPPPPVVLEHIYESPKFDRKHIEGDNVQYYELDPHTEEGGRVH